MDHSQAPNLQSSATNVSSGIPTTASQPVNAPGSLQQQPATNFPSTSPLPSPPPPPHNLAQSPPPQQFSPPPQQTQQQQQPPFQQQTYQPFQPPQQQQQAQQQYQQQPYQQQPQQQQQYGYHIPGFNNMPHIPGMSHFMGGHASHSGGYQTAPSAPPQPQPSPTGAQTPADNDPGTIYEVKGNGTTIRKHADGHKSTQHPDGTLVHEYLDGSTKTINRDGTVSYYTPTTAKSDYVDKAFAMGSKHLGLHLSRDTQEKITDKGRGMFEKFTGKKVSAKWSN